MTRRQLDDIAPPVVMNSKKALTIGDSEAVLNFYDRGFKCIQQTACKEVAKAFVKIIAPKKQANFPYVKGDAAAPDWWPKPWGPGEKDRARHVEPDHMWKKGTAFSFAFSPTCSLERPITTGNKQIIMKNLTERTRACPSPETHPEVNHRPRDSTPKYPEAGTNPRGQARGCRHGFAR